MYVLTNSSQTHQKLKQSSNPNVSGVQLNLQGVKINLQQSIVQFVKSVKQNLKIVTLVRPNSKQTVTPVKQNLYQQKSNTSHTKNPCESLPEYESIDNLSNINQVDGCDTISNSSSNISEYDTEDEVDVELPRLVLGAPSSGVGDPVVQLNDKPDNLSLPLFLILNARSIRQKVNNLKQKINNIKPDIVIISETWETKSCDIPHLLQSNNLKSVSFVRNRDNPSHLPQTGGGTAILYSESNFQVCDAEIKPPIGVEAVWAIVTPKSTDKSVLKVKRICVGGIYISPKSQFKDDTIEHIIHTIHLMRAKFNNEINFIIAGDFNPKSPGVNIGEILLAFGALKQVCTVPTRGKNTLELIITDLHTGYHPPTTMPPLQVDDGKKGKDSDHETVVFAPKTDTNFVVEREKRKITFRPLPEDGIEKFCYEFTRYDWEDVLQEFNPNEKVKAFHSYLNYMLNRHFPEKVISISNLDKNFMTPKLKILHRQMQRELYRNGKTEKFRKMRRKFKKAKRTSTSQYFDKFIHNLKTANTKKWFQQMKHFGGLNKINSGKLHIESLKNLTDQECAEKVAQHFASVSQEYEPVDRQKLPCFLPAEKPPQVNIFQVLEKIKQVKKTRSTLPVDLPDILRNECAIDLAEPMTDIVNSCLTQGTFPEFWRREWVTPVPKIAEPENMSDLRKIASTSDYSKIFEKFLMEWVIEDMGDRLGFYQFAGNKGTGTEHMIVAFVDRIKYLLDKYPGAAVIASGVDWSSAFDRVDPTRATLNLIKLGVRSSLIPIIIEFITDRKMSVKFNQAESRLYTLIGGGPQGSQIGQNHYLAASFDNASFANEDDQFKYCDDLEILDLVFIGNILQEYDFTRHVASDIGIDQVFLPPEKYQTQTNLNSVAKWTDENLMKINEKKSYYLIFTRAQKDFATRLTINNKFLERLNVTKVLGVWISEDGSWSKNTQEILKKGYSRISFLTKLRYAGVKTEDLLELFQLFIRSCAEYCSVAFHSSLTAAESKSLERLQSTCLKVILQENYISYSQALEMTGLESLYDRRVAKCLNFSIKCTKHPRNSRFFPLNSNLENSAKCNLDSNLNPINDTQCHDRGKEQFHVNHGRTEDYRMSAIPYCQRLLNSHFKDKKLPNNIKSKVKI